MKWALLLVFLGVSQASADLITDVRSAIAENDFSRAAAQVRDYRTTKGITPELATAMSWIARGALGRKDYDRAEEVARETYELSTDLLKRRALDAEPVLADRTWRRHRGAGASPRRTRTDNRGRDLPYRPARQVPHNLDLRADSEEHSSSELGGQARSGFAGHFASEREAGAALLLGALVWRLPGRGPHSGAPEGGVRAQGAGSLSAPTQKYGYIARGEEAPPDVELRYIETVRKQSYGDIVDAPAVVSEENFRNYGVSTTPTLLLVDREGIVRMYHPGKMTYDELRTRIQALL